MLFKRNKKQVVAVVEKVEELKTYEIELVKFNMWVSYPRVEAHNYREAKEIAEKTLAGWGWEVKGVYAL